VQNCIRLDLVAGPRKLDELNDVIKALTFLRLNFHGPD
jgi:hypothetical protein